MTTTKPRDVQVVEIGSQTWALRSRTWDRLKFELEYALQKGTTANSYLIRGTQTALLDPPGETFTSIFVEELRHQIDPAQLTWIILGHINPNRATTLRALLALAPQVTLVCSNPAALVLPKLLEQDDLSLQIIRGEETLDLGEGHELTLIPTPTPRWPAGLYTYDAATRILFSDKFYGAHLCGDAVWDENWTSLREDRRYYFDCLHATQPRQVLAALEKLSRRPAAVLAPGHGPLVRYGLRDLTRQYRQWSEDQLQQDLTVALFYASAYGNTATLAQAIGRGIAKAEVAVESVNCEFTSPEDMQAILERCDGFLFGSPTLGGHAPTQIQTALGLVLDRAPKTYLAGVFGSYGWSGEAVDLLETKLRDAGFRFGFEPIRVKFKPTETDLQTCEQAGTDFAQALKKARRQRQSRTTVEGAQSARLEQAVGRIVGPVCVVTARQGALSGAMVATWVSQASFNPPGITVAVAKERAIESLMHQGGHFVLNVLPEGKPLPKHFLKPFAPGEDRLAGLNLVETPAGGAALPDALAVLDCVVQQRLDCGDHWVIYAEVTSGDLRNPNGVTAIHHRRSGSFY